MCEELFSYGEYKEIIQIIKKSGKYSSFHEVKSSSLEEKRREEKRREEKRREEKRREEKRREEKRRMDFNAA